jgi:hypothetical protein
MAQYGDVRPPGLGEEPPPPWEERPRSRRSRRAGRGRGTRRRAATTRWTPKRLGILGGAALAVVLAVALLILLLGGGDDEEPEAAEEEDEELTPEELVAEHPPQEHGELAEVPAWDPAAHGLDENIGELCQVAAEMAGDELAAYDLVNTGPNYCTWEAAAQDGAVPTLQLMLYGPLEETEGPYVEQVGEQIRAVVEAPGGVEAGPVYQLPTEEEGFIRQAVEGSGDQATAEVHAGMRHGAFMTLLSLQEAPVTDEEQHFAELTDFLTALAG